MESFSFFGQMDDFVANKFTVQDFKSLSFFIAIVVGVYFSGRILIKFLSVCWFIVMVVSSIYLFWSNDQSMEWATTNFHNLLNLLKFDSNETFENKN